MQPRQPRDCFKGLFFFQDADCEADAVLMSRFHCWPFATCSDFMFLIGCILQTLRKSACGNLEKFQAFEACPILFLKFDWFVVHTTRPSNLGLDSGLSCSFTLLQLHHSTDFSLPEVSPPNPLLWIIHRLCCIEVGSLEHTI